ncbi:MAG: hypothetical protein CVV64_03300 [Candidatus Wallbacteria bacterium HGW-Wallbacteria-1]|jgi:ComEC/Rec2-related protein|uniref:ComEC/Rec2-related protein domain-containing protein n=1 Tax=Candidatus Wallbacteria bacterium HGW-Wallbacteria-1 TaxID=2013854 RepID=A0A2N1PTN1_9BACT|nr:MAG: hypothetical protein CVV64_03300 [Candidatus Wallbacteria bacterium HGW-Wallbacteria-1]
MIQPVLMAFTIAYVMGVAIAMSLFDVILQPGPFAIAAAFPAIAILLFNVFPGRRPPFYFTILLVCATGLLAGFARYYGALAIDTPNHLSKFLDQDRFSQTVVIGTVDKEPDIREKKTIVSLRPEKVLKGRGGKVNLRDIRDTDMQPVEGGLLWIEIGQETGDLQYQVQYGDRIILVSNLSAPPPATNPGLFSYRDFLHHQNYFAMAKIKKPSQLKRLGVGDVNPVVAFSLQLKSDFLVIIKKTMPFAESAFLGGVQLGCRGGVSQKVQDDFRKSGVSHVLAVSGLHVTIIATMFYIILSSMRIPRKIFVPIIIVFLIIFTIITGARPSSTRAALMNSLVLIIMTYFNHSLKSSLLFGLSVAAVFVLWYSPLILFEPGFTLSFAAILSLAFITEPFEALCCRWVRGMKMVALTAEGIIGIALFCFFGDLMKIRTNLLLFFSACLLFFLWAVWMDRRGQTVDVSFEDLPPIVRSFTGAQGAILIGMMWPLSAFYFNQISLSAPLANFLAIPLIGVIVQIGLIAGIMGMVPVFGIHMALVLNAGNWICVNFFLWMATYFADLLPAPMIPSPTPLQLFLYYVAVGIFCFWDDVSPWIKLRIKGLLKSMEVSGGWKRAVSTGIVIGLILSPVCILWGRAGKSLHITVLDVRFGDSLVIEAPDGSASLIDGGGKSLRIDDSTGKQVEFSQGSRTIHPVLLKKRITSLRSIVITSAASEHTGGLEHLIREFGPAGMEAIYVPWDMSDFGPTLEPDEFAAALNTEEYSKRMTATENVLIYQCMAKSYREAMKLGIPFVQISEDQFIDFGGGVTGYPVFAAPQGVSGEVCAKFSDCSMGLRIEYGKSSLLVSSDLGLKAQKRLASANVSGSVADILMLPAHSAADLDHGFVRWTGTRTFLASYGFAGMQTGRRRDSNIGRLMSDFTDATLFSTSEDGAIELVSKGSGWELKTIATDREVKISSPGFADLSEVLMHPMMKSEDEK